MRIALVLLLLAACQDKSKQVPPTGSGSGTTVVTPQPDAAPAKPPLELPKLSGKPAPKTTKPHPKEQLETLSKLEFPGFDKDLRKLDTGFLNVKQRTKTRPKASITVTVLPCTPKQCMPLKADAWRAQKEALMVTLAPELRDRPDTTFEIGEATLGGEKLIYVYQLGQHYGKDEVDNPTGAYSHAYILYHHDGINQIRVIAEYTDDPQGSTADLARAIPRQTLEMIATAFLDAYVQGWGN